MLMYYTVQNVKIGTTFMYYTVHNVKNLSSLFRSYNIEIKLTTNEKKDTPPLFVKKKS